MSSVAALERLQEDMKSQRWRLWNLYRIKNKDGKVVPFRPNWAQQLFYDDMWYLNVILKARQLGFSTFINIIQLDTCLFNSNYFAGIIAQDKEAVKKIFSRNVKFPFTQLPGQLQDVLKGKSNSVNGMSFSTGSEIHVATSMRSGTVQFLHISEFGKICAKYPEKAKEIVTGSLEAVGKGNIVAIESTAEGQAGYFYDYCETAKGLKEAGTKLSALDYKFFFFPWWQEPTYALDPELVTITREQQRYFDELEQYHEIKTSPEQRAWYVKKLEKLGSDMKREYPSTPEEAFANAVEGTYYYHELHQAQAQNRIRELPIQDIPVYTYWDLGRNDSTAVWFAQKVGGNYYFVDYYENSGYGIKHYADKLKELKEKHGWVYAEHYMPHDARVTDFSESSNQTRQELFEGFGVKPINLIPRTTDLMQAITVTRSFLSKCWFDPVRCADGLKWLRLYRKDWDETRGCYRDQPAKGPQNHAADALRQAAQADIEEVDTKPLARRRHRRSARTA